MSFLLNQVCLKIGNPRERRRFVGGGGDEQLQRRRLGEATLSVKIFIAVYKPYYSFQYKTPILNTEKDSRTSAAVKSHAVTGIHTRTTICPYPRVNRLDQILA